MHDLACATRKGRVPTFHMHPSRTGTPMLLSHVCTLLELQPPCHPPPVQGYAARACVSWQASI